ncbi:MAG: serine acetyltransferase [Oscillospiraceae bacterium]|nr:serine acetyltransferase [Oscillospiraceae bacterium]
MNQALKEILHAERVLYIPHIKTLKNKIMAMYTHSEEYEIYRFIRALRKAEFYKSKSKLIYTYYLRKSNICGNRLGYFIAPGVLGKGVRLYHRGGIIINSNSQIGDGCLFHGDNCVGNNGMDNRCPVLGKNVELGIGAKVIGGITLADGIRVGANAVVTKSFSEAGITIAGVPAVKVK